jgi:hypothetical protein
MTKKQVDAELELAVKRHNWDEYFGKAVDDDLKVVVGFKHGANTTCYSGQVLMPDFDECNGTQRVHFPVAEANLEIGTAKQQRPDDHIDIRLDTLLSTNEDTCFWVKQSCLHLPFIKTRLTALKLDGAKQATRKRRSRIIKASDEDSDNQGPKKVKLPLPKPKPKPKTLKKTKAQETTDMMQRMRQLQ